MEDKRDLIDTEDQEPIVVITDEEGNETYYLEEMVIPVNNKNFAILTQIPEDENSEDEEEAEDNCIIARIEFDENGDPTYLDPTDEEFDLVAEAYNQMMDDLEKD